MERGQVRLRQQQGTTAMPVVNGTAGDDTLPGTNDHDLINGLQGNDTITAEDGDDLVRPDVRVAVVEPELVGREPAGSLRGHDERADEDPAPVGAVRARAVAALPAGLPASVPMLALRLTRFEHLIDLNRIRELDYVNIEDGELRIGAMTRQRALERSPIVTEHWPILSQATRYIGHVHIRNRGTVGGSLAHAYPAAELPVVMTALDAVVVLRNRHHQRIVAISDFFVDVMTTALQPDELLLEVRVPKLAERTGTAFQEISRRHGDFALMAAAAVVTLSADGTIERVRLAFAGAVPTRAHSAEQELVRKHPERGLFRAAANNAAAALSCETDIHGTAAYRRQVAEVLASRALEQAVEKL